MEAKKNPSQDVHRQSGKFFLIGLILSVALAITAFEWRSPKQHAPQPRYDEVAPEAVFQLKAHITQPEKIVEPEKKLIPPQPIKTFTSISNSESLNETDPQPHVEFDPNSSIGFDSIELIPETTEEIFLYPEVKPEPEGGMESFYRFIGKTLKYPKRAQYTGTQGKVFIEFVIDKNGHVTNMKVIKGIGSGCDEEAMRVLALTKWQPGRQRGKPVKVRMTMPLNFVLN
ncbi:MAG TPA: TonB family protein [Cyclobacteriaceae bacterium]|jgi:protein TonB|nr:TonB family protein [Cyclobacteriaceae bacterium]HRE66451.1 TonB family protein [Cyclobacteriaceae bacterium]HRF32016.1 TonB family protein [Cyclobacteriaceae bacterium]